MLTIGRETPSQPEVQSLLDEADARFASLYPAESRFGSTVAGLLAQNVRFFVARLAAQAVGYGGYALTSDGCAELKRIFVKPAARGTGVGRQIIFAIEQEAKAEGVVTLLLETGVKSVEALRLYQRLGYTRRGPFGSYGPDPLCVFMEKPLAGA